MNKIKKLVAVVLAALMLTTTFAAVPIGADEPTVIVATHPYKFNMGWRSGYNPVTYGSNFRSINTSGGTTYEYYLKGLNNTEIRMYCLDHRLASPAGADIMCQGSVASFYGTKVATYLNGIAAFDQFGYKNTVVAKLSEKRHRESLTQLALWYASQEMIRGNASSVTFNNALFKADVKTMLKAYGLSLLGLQGTWMSYKGLTWADVTGYTEDQLYDLFATDYVTNLDAYIQNPTCVSSFNDTVYTSVWTGISTQQPMMVISSSANPGSIVPENYSGVVYAYKSDELGNMIQGVTFGIFENAACTNRITTMTTDSNGYATATISLTDDMRTTKTVYVKEISAPANYRMDSTVYTCVVKTYNKDIAEISSTSRWTRVGGANATIVNAATGYLTITKTDNAGHTLGEGVIFGLYTDAACTNKVDEFATNTSGIATSKAHDRGTYYLKELSVPESFHVLLGSEVTEITLNIGENKLTVQNTLLGQISVTKKDDAGNILGVGFIFGLYSDENCTNLVEKITTNFSGTATSSYLVPGETYYIKEIGLPVGASEIYSTNNTVYPVTVASSLTINQVVVNNRKTILSVTKKDDAGTTLGKGYVFGIYADEDCTVEVARMTTDASGVATSERLDTATYYVKELALPSEDNLHVLNDTVYTVVGKPGETTLVNDGVIVNKRAIGNLVITKQDSAGHTLGEGVVFGLFTDAACTDKIDEFATNANGIATSDYHLRGTYYLKELSVPDSFHVMLSSDVTEITLAVGENTMTVKNTLMGRISVTKKDDAGTILGAGYVFGLYADANCKELIETITTGDNGVATSGYYAPGTVCYIKEIEVPTGADKHYTINTSVYNATVVSGETVNQTVVNTRKTSFALTKVDDAGNKLGAGFVFGIYSDAECTVKVGEMITGEDSIAKSELFDVADFYVKELSIPNTDKQHEIDPTIYKVSGAPGETVLVNNGFIVNSRKIQLSVTKIDDAGNKLGAGYVFGIFSDAKCTTKVGEMVTDADSIATSDYLSVGTYFIQELSIPDTDKQHDIDTTVYEAAGRSGEMVLVNNGFIINKSTTSSGKITKTSEDGVIKGLKFRLYGTSDTGLAVDKTIATDEKGVALFTDIPLGTYTIDEVDIPEYYQVPEPQTITIVVGEVAEVAFRNLLDPGTIVIKKVDVWTDTLVPGAEIALYEFIDGEYVELEREVTDENGRVYFAAPAPGVFYYHEISAPMGYYLDEDYYEIVVDEDLNVTGKATFREAPFGTVVLKKVNEKGEYLPGATLAVFDAEGKELFRGVTDECGRIYFAAPVAGEYYFTEIKAPKGFKLNPEKHYFNIDADGNISGTCRMVDEHEKLPATGDASFMIYGGMAVSSLASLVVLGKKRKKEEEE